MKRLALLMALLGLTACASVADGTRPAIEAAQTANPTCGTGATAMGRVELIFGATWDKGPITDRMWRRFLKEEVTPRFPDGLTVLEGYGQWRRSDTGKIVRLPSRILLIWYTKGPEAEAHIEAVRAAFKTRYNQLSVMRVDGQDCVSF